MPEPALLSTEYVEWNESTEETAIDSQSATRTFLLYDDAKRALFEQRFLGYVYLDALNYWKIEYPVVHPVRKWLRASAVSWQNREEDYRQGDTGIPYDPALAQAPLANGAIATVTYTRAPWKVAGYDTGENPDVRDLINAEFKNTSRNLTLPNDRYVWSTQGKVGTAPGADSTPILLAQDGVQAYITIPTQSITVIRFMAPDFPVNAISQLQNRVNEKEYSILNKKYAPETLKLLDAEMVDALGPNGWRGWTIRYTFEAILTYDDVIVAGTGGAAPTKSTTYVGWNRLFDPSRNIWDYVNLLNNSSRKIFKSDTEVKQTFATSGASEDVKGFDLLFDPRAY
ncbi:hypothetical protein KIH39_00075 [Telmatocola sphagniphila]|uniref:Uncharacterized protein n=1 Tax=Telmatocola sphagniphila TaxID=1123043 RepID=A0A8E6EYG7_9BACT|nr:hypothetical protein [Telmatocola sphagniphila]QVL32351.1 hypothetical protein KIH39_00075 [Telmatocola sphagniphila]